MMLFARKVKKVESESHQILKEKLWNELKKHKASLR